jgi:hypothetical protein
MKKPRCCSLPSSSLLRTPPPLPLLLVQLLLPVVLLWWEPVASFCFLAPSSHALLTSTKKSRGRWRTVIRAEKAEEEEEEGGGGGGGGDSNTGGGDDGDESFSSCESFSSFPSSSSSSATTAAAGAAAIEIVESDFPGAGVPRVDLPPRDVPSLLMEALRHNDFPGVDSGLRSVWAFAGDTVRHVYRHNVTDFIETAHRTAREFPTSLYGAAMYGRGWEVETPLNLVGGGDGGGGGDGCWIATQVIRTVSADGRSRRWQWELRKRRRPPNRDCWYVESVASSDRRGRFEPE